MYTQLSNVSDLYEHFDQLAFNDADSDILFASSYLRGFIALSVSEFGDESQTLSKALAASISEKLAAAKTELSPADRALVNEYWGSLQSYFVAG